jgi:hypothetical protein
MSDRIDVTATIRATDAASAAINSINRSLQGLTKTAASVGEAFRHISHAGAFGGLGHNIQHLGGALRSVGQSFHEILEPLAAIAGIAGGFSVGESLEGYIGDAEHLDRMAKVLGTTADALGAYEFAAKKAGLETEGFDKSMQFATLNMRKGALGLDKNMVGLFAKLKIPLKDIRDGTKSAMDYLPQLAQAMQAQTSPNARLALARGVFGRAGAAMIPFLLQGAKAIKEQTDAYKEQSHITEESAKEAVEFGHKQHDLQRTFLSLRDAVGNAVIPVLTEALGSFQKFLNDPTIRGEIVKDLTEAFKGLAEGLKEFKWREFYDGIRAVIDWIKEAVHWVGGWRNALIILAVVINAELIVALLELGTAIGKVAIIIVQQLIQALAGASRAVIWLGSLLMRALLPSLAAAGRAVVAFGAALLSTPLGWILAAIAAIAVGVYLLYRNWDTVGPWFWRQWETVKQAFISAKNWLDSWIPDFSSDQLTALWQSLPATFDSIMGEVLAALGRFSLQFASWVTGFTPDEITKAWADLTGYFDRIWGEITGIFDRAWEHIRPIIDAISHFASSVGGAIGGALNAVGLGGPTPAMAGPGGGPAPIWNLNNPIGADTLGPQPPAPGSILGPGTGAPGAPGASGKVQVEVTLGGAVPPGTTTSTRATGSVVPDIGISMPPYAF